MNNFDIVRLFCEVDDFVKQHQVEWKQIQIECANQIRQRKGNLSLSEIMTIMIMFHQSNFRTFKYFYIHLQQFYNQEFPRLVSYSRFVRLMPKTVLPLCAYAHSLRGKVSGISFIDSTPIQVCKPKRMSRNKVFKGIAQTSKSTIGWFFGLKLHLIVNDSGEILAFTITAGNVDDRTPVPQLVKELWGKLFADKGYISQKLCEYLASKNISFFSGLKKGMKNKIICLKDKVLLRKRCIIETINDQLKNISQIEHSRHRSVANCMLNILCGVIAYCKQPKKPSIKDNCMPLELLA
jgi:IS5 family transposase